MKKKLIFLFILLFSLGVLFFFYLNYIFFPFKLKQIIEHKAARMLHRAVSIEEIHFKLIKGFTLRNVTLWEKETKDQPFLKIEEADFNILIAPLIKEKAIIIPSLKITHPYLYLSRENNAVWNFSDLLPQSTGNQAKIPFKFYLFKIVLKDGIVDCVDKTSTQVFSETLNALNAEIQLVFNKNITFKSDGRIPSRGSSFHLEGSYDFAQKKFLSQISLDKIHLGQYLSLFLPASRVSLQEGILTTPHLTVGFDPKDFQVTGNLLFENTFLILNPHQTFQGDIRLNNLLLNVDQAKTMFIQADTEIKNVLLSLGQAGTITAEIKALPSALAWNTKDNKIDINSQMEIKNFSFSRGEHLKIQTDITASVKTAAITPGQFSFEGNLNLNNTRADLDSDFHFQGNLSAKDISLNIQNNSLKLLGDIIIQGGHLEKGLQLSAAGEITAAKVELILSNPGKEDQTLSLQTNAQIDPLKLNLGKDQYFYAKILSRPLLLTYQNQKLNLQSQFQINEGEAAFNPQIKFKGNPNGEITLSYLLQTTPVLEYNGSINLSEAKLSGLPVVGLADQIDGKILFKTDNLETQNLTFRTQGMDVRLDGSLNNFTSPQADLQADINHVNLERISSFFPNILEKTQIKLSGEADCQIRYKGLLLSPKEADIKSTALLKNITLTNQKWQQPITDISGRVNYAPNLIQWENLRGTFKNETYRLTGELTDFSRPVLKASLSSSKINLDTYINILNQAFQIISLKGNYLNNPFDIRGDVHLLENGDPDFDLRGTLSLNTQELSTLMKDWAPEEVSARWQEKINTYKPDGTLSLEWLWRGTLKDWRNWQLTFKAQSPKLSVLGLSFKNLNIDYSQREQYIQQCAASASLYEGALNFNSSADLHEELIPAQANLTLTDLNLAKLKEDRELKDKDLAGKLSGTIVTKGPLLNSAQLLGQGSLTIREGHIYQWRVLQWILDLLTMKEIKDVVFTDAGASFIIKNKKIITADARMISQPLTLNGKGWIDFDKNLHFNVIPHLSEIALLKSKSNNKWITALIAGVISIEITGTIDTPSCAASTSPMRAIKNTADYIKDGLEGILQGTFYFK